MAQHTAVQGKPAQKQTTVEEYEPLLPVEKKLIVWSLVLGVILLVILIGVSYAFFPGSF